MPYPSSSDVAAGDITAASQYNNLRADALRFGQASADAVNAGSLLELYESNLKIIRLNTTQLRIEATLASPVSLMVAGYPARTTANVDLAVGMAPSGPANPYYIFANRAAGSSSFTLSVSTSFVEAANQRRIGQCYWNGTEIVKDSIQTELSKHVSSLLFYKEPFFQCGRLTLATNDPVPAYDIPTSSLVYFTPYKGNRISLYVPGYGWRLYTFNEISLDISSFTINKNYDIFIYDNAGALTLEGVEWSNDTLRAVALYSQDGRWVKSSAYAKLYLGTFRCSGVGYTRDRLNSRLLWNMYNRVARPFSIIEPTNSWTYNSATFRPFNGTNTNKVEYVVGLVEDMLFLQCQATALYTGAAYTAVIGIGVDSETVSTPTIACFGATATAVHSQPMVVFSDYPLLGFHYLCMLEASIVGTVAVIFYGDNGLTYQQSGGYGWIYA